MRKQYMDFVPAKAAKRPVQSVRRVATTATMVKRTTKIVSKPNRPVSRPIVRPVSEPASGAAPEEVKLGVIEDLSSEVKPQPVKAAPAQHFATKQSAVRAAKAQKVGQRAPSVGRKASSVAAKAAPVEAARKPATEKKADSTYKTPKTPFINQDKVKKRPLSKNVYRKKVETPKEEAKAPVTIITKPEKDAKIGLIITIILTIILGAAAGTVAFLLLPK